EGFAPRRQRRRGGVCGQRGAALNPAQLQANHLRIVLDATVLVRAHPRSRSRARKALNAVLEGHHTLLLSNEIMVETTRVLRYPRLQKLYALTDDELYDYAQFLQEVSQMVI